MSSPAHPPTPVPEPYERLWRRLPQRLRPRTSEPAGRGELRLVELAVLLLVGLLLAIATVNDVARQVGVNHRLIADLRTWRRYTHHDYKNVAADQELLGAATHRDVVCGNTTPGPPKQRPQICLVVTGPISGGVRPVAGGWYLPPGTEDNVRSVRYGCFGSVTKGLCPTRPAAAG
jgi:hypothetical protein